MADKQTSEEPAKEYPSGSPRRIRFTDARWNAGEEAAKARGEELAEVIRRKVAQYAQLSDEGWATEYRATALKDPAFVVSGITWPLAEVLSAFPREHWLVESYERSPYHPPGRPPTRRRGAENAE